MSTRVVSPETDGLDAQVTRLLRSLVQEGTDLLAVCAEDGTLLYVTPSLTRILGYDPDDVIGITSPEVMHPDDLPLVIDAFVRARTDRRADIEFRAHHRDGSWRWLELVVTNLLDDPSVDGFVINGRDVTEGKRVEEELARLALYDSLTGLANRARLLDHLEQALAHVRRTGSLAAVLFLDLDHFKVINDGLGHAAGDDLLVHVAQRIKTVLREGDTAARLGGDEFVLCCENLCDRDEALVIAERVATVLGDPVVIDGHEIGVTASIGLTFVAGGGRAADEVLRDADTAMYRAKDHGRARCEVFDASFRRRALAKLDEHLDLRRALAAHQFRLTYQPVVSVAEGTLVGSEVLLRWAHPRRGVVPPSEFIPVAEETGAIVSLGAWVLAEACREVAEWNRALDIGRRLNTSVNLSARQLADVRLPDMVASALTESGLEPSLLWLEITESVVMDDAGAATGALKDLKRLGVRLAIDDFGTGYSSLAYLKRFPVDMLKIDRCFVAGLDDESENRAIVAAVLGLGKTLGLEVVAEGVETAAQLGVLRDLGCDLAQGYYFSEPVPPQHLEDFVHRNLTW